MWLQQQEARAAAVEETLKYGELQEEEWDNIASEVAQQKRAARPAGTQYALRNCQVSDSLLAPPSSAQDSNEGVFYVLTKNVNANIML